MGKSDFLTPKAIANRIKSKGLQKLRWYCQMCQKQCRDEVSPPCPRPVLFPGGPADPGQVPEAGGAGEGPRSPVVGSVLGESAAQLSRAILPCSPCPSGEQGVFDTAFLPRLPPKEMKLGKALQLS